MSRQIQYYTLSMHQIQPPQHNAQSRQHDAQSQQHDAQSRQHTPGTSPSTSEEEAVARGTWRATSRLAYEDHGQSRSALARRRATVPNKPLPTMTVRPPSVTPPSTAAPSIAPLSIAPLEEVADHETDYNVFMALQDKLKQLRTELQIETPAAVRVMLFEIYEALVSANGTLLHMLQTERYERARLAERVEKLEWNIHAAMETGRI
ncbi:hypothetical protein LTR53_014382 [Teratosphaeriaceae sp. CCFEE 6253]|nr:hypothetical protein LTR53_014382 [Teratosphaeriaceae sp. CCFEE 6253]